MLGIGIDIGGTKTELVALDDAGRECLRRREPTPHGGYPEALRRLAGLVLAANRNWASPRGWGLPCPAS